MLGDLGPCLFQLRPRLQVHVHGLAADPAGQVPLRVVTAVPRPGARAVRLAALGPHPVQRTPLEVPGLGDQAEQLSTAPLQPRQVPARKLLRHARLQN